MLHLTSENLQDVQTDALVIPVFENPAPAGPASIDALIARVLELKEFTGAIGEDVIWYSVAGMKAERLIFTGLGKQAELDAERIRSMAGRIVQKAMKSKFESITFLVPPNAEGDREDSLILGAMLEGSFLANHLLDGYKTEANAKPLEAISFLVTAESVEKKNDLINRVTAVCKATLLARNWVNTPANDKKPAELARRMIDQARKKGLKTQLLDREDLEGSGFGALLAVGAASPNPPQLVVIDYLPPQARNTIVLVGKGVTFDSGGLNIKTTKTLNIMKSDMAGAAAVAATLLAVPELSIDTRVIGILPLVENLVSGQAMCPGDIIRTHSGKTVEVGNTDAEGRLILADAISYGIQTYKPDVVIDMATLTGACAIAMGERIAAVFSPDDDLAAAISRAGEQCFERCWRMPLPHDYREYMKSDLADLNNMSSSRYGGAITAALFLSSFVDEKTRWAHIDIAGPAYRKAGGDYYTPGGTGFGVRLLCRLLETVLT